MRIKLCDKKIIEFMLSQNRLIYFHAKFDLNTAYGKGCKEGINYIDLTKRAFYPSASSSTQSESLSSLKLYAMRIKLCDKKIIEFMLSQNRLIYFHAKFDLNTAYGKGCKEGINHIDSMKRSFYPLSSSSTQSESLSSSKLYA